MRHVSASPISPTMAPHSRRVSNNPNGSTLARSAAAMSKPPP
jgi:hypothetical protein